MRRGKRWVPRAAQAVALLLGILGMGCVTSSTSFAQHEPHDELRLVVQEEASADGIVGTWEAREGWLESVRPEDHVQLTVVRKGDGRTESRSRTVRGLELDRDPNGWSVERPAGAIRLVHDPDAGRTFTVEPDVEFFARAAEAGMAEPAAHEVLQLVWSGVTSDYVAGVNEGSRGLTWTEVLKLHTGGVTLDFVQAVREPAHARESDAEEGETDAPPPVEYSVDDMVMLSFRGVTADYITALRDAGYGFSAKEVADMRFRGVRAEYAAEVKQAGYDFSSGELCDLRFRGVSADYMARLRKAGYRFTPKELADLRFRGVGADYAEALAEPGYEPLEAADLIKLRFRGVDPELVKALRPAASAEEEPDQPGPVSE